MILCDSEIRAALRHGQIKIEPAPSSERFTTSAVDLTLGDEFKRWKTPGGGAITSIDPSSDEFSIANISDLLEDVPFDGGVVLEPGRFILGRTSERIELPEYGRIAARVEGRSSLARIGLGVHVTAPTIHSGFRGTITLEMTNHGSMPIHLRPGLPICQLIFEQLFGTPGAEMMGAFQDQASVLGPSTGKKKKGGPQRPGGIASAKKAKPTRRPSR